MQSRIVYSYFQQHFSVLCFSTEGVNLIAQKIWSHFCSPCRRSVIEAVYNRLNPYREEDGVSICDDELCPSPAVLTHTQLMLKSWGHIAHLSCSGRWKPPPPMLIHPVWRTKLLIFPALVYFHSLNGSGQSIMIHVRSGFGTTLMMHTLLSAFSMGHVRMTTRLPKGPEIQLKSNWNPGMADESISVLTYFWTYILQMRPFPWTVCLFRYA